MLLILLTVCKAGTISGHAINRNMNQHDKIVVELLDENLEKIDSTLTSFSGKYTFEEVLIDKHYSVRVGGTTKAGEKFFMDKKYKEIGLIYNEYNKERFYMYLFSNILIFCILVINFIIFKFIKEGKNVLGKKYIQSSLFVFNIWFVVEFIRFIIGFGNECIAAKMWPLSHFGTIFAPLLIWNFFIRYPAKKQGLILKVINISLWAVLSTIFLGINIWWMLGSDRIFNNFSKIKIIDIVLTYEIINFSLFAFILYILIENVVKGITEEIKSISFSFLRVITVSIGILAISIIYFALFKIDEPFMGYYNTILGVIGLTIYWNILKYVFGFYYMEGYSKLIKIFIELLKYAFIIFVTFIIFNLFKVNNRSGYLLLMIYFILLKLGIDMYYAWVVESRFVKFEMISSKLETAFSIEGFESILIKELKKRLEFETGKLIVESNSEKILYDKIKNINATIIGEEKLEEIFGTNEYKFALKLLFGKEVKAILLCDNIKSGKMLRKDEIDFLYNISKNAGKTLNNIEIFEAKTNMTMEKKKIDNSKEILMYSNKFFKLIKDKTDDEDIVEICDNMILKLEKEVE
jgi:hypothetical protein